MSARVLVVDDEAGLREMLAILMRRAGFHTDLAEGVETALAMVKTGPSYDVVITDLLMRDGSGMQVLEGARAHDESTQVVMITAYATTAQAVEAMRNGAYDYIQKPFRNDELRATVEKALEKRRILTENRALRARVEDIERSRKLVGNSPAMRRVFEMINRVAGAQASVLITGESGTGKEGVARALHEQSARAEGPYVIVNCGAIPEALMESELFGHKKGSFTGADHEKEGLFRRADGGTLVLDEVAELPPSLQVKLLRALQEKTVRSVGAEDEVSVDVRLVAATNRDLEEEVAEGRFREDLFYRLNVIRIHLPPLRERREDVQLLSEHLLRKHAALQNKQLRLSPAALGWLESQAFPGNVRELENVIERAVTLADGDTVDRGDLPEGPPGASPARPSAIPKLGEGFDLDGYLGDLEKRILVEALALCGGVRTTAAKRLGMSFRSFRYRLAKYGLGDED